MTEKDLPTLLRSLRETAPKINKTTDEANLAIRLVEDFLASLSLGIPSHIVMSREQRAVSEDGERAHFEHLLCLHYRRHGNAFRLLLEESDLYEEGDHEREEILSTTPLAEASRHEKLRAVTEIPDLLEQIVAEANAVQADAAKAVRAVDMLVAALVVESPARLNPIVSAHLKQKAELERPVPKK